MKPEKLILELEEILGRLGYRIRKERGNFQGGFCVLEGEKLIMLNKNHPPDVLCSYACRFLKELDTDDMYLKPAVRRAIEKQWEELDRRTGLKERDLFSEDES